MSNADLPAMPIPGMDMQSVGLSKREYIAAMAMQGYCAGPEAEAWTVETIAKVAVKQADALLSELERTGAEP